MEMQRTSSELIQDMTRLGVGRSLRAIVDEAQEDEFPSKKFEVWRKNIADLDRESFAQIVRATERSVQSWEYQSRSPSKPVLRMMRDLAYVLETSSFGLGEIKERGIIILGEVQ